MKSLIIAAVLVAAPLAAHAETFTFATYTKVVDRMALPPASAVGRPKDARVFAAATLTTFADGHTQSTKAMCSSRPLPPGSQFATVGVCAYMDAGQPLYSTQFSCEAPRPGAAGINCHGLLVGQGGPWKGRTGAFDFVGLADGSSHGEGQWN